MLTAKPFQALPWLRGGCLICLTCAGLGVLAGTGHAENETASAPTPAAPADALWRRLELPREDPQGSAVSNVRSSISDVAVEPQGSLWVMGRQGVYYWTGSQFAKPKGEPLRSGQYVANLWGGGDRPLYASQPATSSTPGTPQGRLFRLQDGEATYVTDFYYDVPHDYPGIHITKTGQIINWGETFLAVYDGASWTRQEAAIPRRTATVESEHGFHLFTANRVVTIDRAGQFHKHELNLPADASLVCPTPWGDDRLLVYDSRHRQLLAYELPDFQLIELKESSRVSRSFFGRAPVPAPDGSVWLQLPVSEVSQQLSLYRLASDGSVAPIAADPTGRWVYAQRNSPSPVLFAKDGSAWLASDNQGIFRLKEGKTVRYGWREGVAEGRLRAIVEDDAGNTFAYYHHGVWMMPADGQRSPLPDWTRVWSEYPLAAARPVQDDAQRLWMALGSHPRAISCWDGAKFTHREVPFDTASLVLLLIDDQQHVLAMLRDPLRNTVTYHDVGPDSSATYGSLDEMFVASVKRGTKKFFSTDEIRGPLVDPQRRIWYAYGHDAPVRMFNGETWLTLRGVTNVHASVSGEVLASNSRQIARYDRGILTPIPPHPDAVHVRMYGPAGLVPFEPSIYLHAPQDFLLVDKDSRIIAKATADPAGPDKVWQFQPGEKKPHYMGSNITGGRFGSLWTSYAACDLHRLVVGHAVVSDFDNTPVEGQSYITNNIYDDAAGNLWIHRSSRYNARNSMFMKDTSQFRLQPPYLALPIPLKTTHLLTATDATGQTIKPNLLWQIDDGAWTRSSTPGELTLDFAQPGKHRIRILAIGPQAELCQEMIEADFEVKEIEIR